MILEIITGLAQQTQGPCVTISFATHRTHPENLQDGIVLRNLVREADDRLVAEFGKRDIRILRERLRSLADETDMNYNLDSLHIFLSNSVKELVKSPWTVEHDTVQIGDSFAIRPLIKMANRTDEYHILLLSQSGVSLFSAVNDAITEEIKNEDFPISENRHFLTHKDKISDSKQVDKLLLEFLNKVDKAVRKVLRAESERVIVVSTAENYTRLCQVADQPSLYSGHVPVDYNRTARYKIAADAWELVKQLQADERKAALESMLDAAGQGLVLTGLQDIYRAAREGRGELLITHDQYQQPVKMLNDASFELISDPATEGAIDDITSEIAWEVFSKKGRVVYTSQPALDALGPIALKLRY